MNKKIVPVALAVLLALSIYTMMPLLTAQQPNTIQIGVIASTTAAYEDLRPFIEEIIEPDINAYCAKLPPTRFRPPLSFDFIVADAQGSAETHLQIIEDFHNARPHGVDLVIGAPWSSFADAALDYVNDNGILLFSPSSTVPALAIPDDNLFRLCPDETRQGAAIAEMLHSRGVKSIIVLQRDDTWAESLYETINMEFEDRGGIILERIVYPTDTEDFTGYLQMAEDAAVAATPAEEPVAVQLISVNEVVPIVSLAWNYPTIYDLEWFGCQTTARNEELLEDAPDQATKLKIYSTSAAPDYSWKYEEMATRYEDLMGNYFSFYTACYADIAWIIAQAVLEVHGIAGAPPEATDVSNVIPDIASRYYGYTGWCLLNEAGDRYRTDYDIWGYGMIDGWPSFVHYGYYDSETGQVHWS
jgi:branched-chain amino acid transport system substrate-binding protein